MAKFAINASGAMLLPSLVLVSESISGSVVPLAMFRDHNIILRHRRLCTGRSGHTVKIFLIIFTIFPDYPNIICDYHDDIHDYHDNIHDYHDNHDNIHGNS